MKHIYYKRTLQIKPKMGTHWPPRSWNGNRHNIFVLPIRKVISWVESVSYSSGGGRASATATATATRQVSILFVISTNSRQNRGSVDRLAGNKPSDLLGIQSPVNYYFIWRSEVFGFYNVLFLADVMRVLMHEFTYDQPTPLKSEV